MTTLLDTERLLQPLEQGGGTGEDMSYSLEFDQIREARRADDPNLSQGEWESDVKSSDWRAVVRLTTELLEKRTKDLQVALWLVEGLAQQHGFKGLAQGLAFATQMIDTYWESLHPVIEDDDLGERVGKLEWFNTRFPELIGFMPVVDPARGPYSLAHWREALSLENLAARDPEAFQKALDAGKVQREVIEKAMRLSGATFYQGLVDDVTRASEALDAFDELVGKRFGDEAPSLASVRNELASVSELVLRFAREMGAAPESTAAEQRTEPVLDAADVPAGSFAGPIKSRAQALAQLREVAAFFRRTEPHSPVAYLADKAAAWGNLSLDQWLRAVVKDEAVLGQLEETLGVMPRRESSEES